jgi:hypothetical protein
MPRVSRVTVEGLDEASRHLTKFLKTLQTVPTQVLLEEAPRIEQTAKNRTPVDTGKLRNSVKVRVSRDKRRPGMYAQASAVHNGYDYAYIQHENEAYNHPNGGQAHFLESAFVEGVERIERRLQTEVRYDK